MQTLMNAPEPEQQPQPSTDSSFVVNKLLLWFILVPLVFVLLGALLGMFR